MSKEEYEVDCFFKIPLSMENFGQSLEKIIKKHDRSHQWSTWPVPLALKIVLFLSIFKKWRRTDKMCKYNDHYCGRPRGSKCIFIKVLQLFP